MWSVRLYIEGGVGHRAYSCLFKVKSEEAERLCSKSANQGIFFKKVFRNDPEAAARYRKEYEYVPLEQGITLDEPADFTHTVPRLCQHARAVKLTPTCHIVGAAEYSVEALLRPCVGKCIELVQPSGAPTRCTKFQLVAAPFISVDPLKRRRPRSAAPLAT